MARRLVGLGAVVAAVVVVVVWLTGGFSGSASRATPGPDGSRSAATSHPRRPALVDDAEWQSTSEGYRLIVTPSGYGRLHAHNSPGRALDQAIDDAAPTPLTIDATTRQSLRDQLLCHAVFAAVKPTWNLETWRPDVGVVRTIADLCNP